MPVIQEIREGRVPVEVYTAEIEATVARGWLIEGPVFCVPR